VCSVTNSTSTPALLYIGGWPVALPPLQVPRLAAKGENGGQGFPLPSRRGNPKVALALGRLGLGGKVHLAH
jgi:hypothetical protein